MPGIMGFSVDTPEDRKEFRRYIDSQKDPEKHAYWQDVYDEMIEEYRERHPQEVKAGIERRNETLSHVHGAGGGKSSLPKSNKTGDEYRPLDNPPVPIGQSYNRYDREYAAGPTAHNQNNLEGLKEQERKNINYIRRLKKTIGHHEPGSDAFNYQMKTLEEAIRRQSQIQAEIRALGGKESKGDAKEARTIYSNLEREAKQYREQKQKESPDEASERRANEYAKKQRARAESTAYTTSARSQAKQDEYEARAQAKEAEYEARESARMAADAARERQKQMDHEIRMEEIRLRQRGVSARERRRAMRDFRRTLGRGATGAVQGAVVASKKQKYSQARSRAGRRPTTVASRVPARQSQVDYVPSIHDSTYERVIASGGVEALVFGSASFASAAWISSRKNDIWWALGSAGLGFLVAGGARDDATIRDIALGWGSGAAAVFTLRMLGKLNRFNGQQ